MSKKLMFMFCLILFIVNTAIPFFGIAKAQAMARVFIDPPEVTGLTIGDNFTITIKVADVSDLAAWEVKLFYNPDVVSVTDAQEGPFLSSVRDTFFLKVDMNDNYNATHGRIYLACALLKQGAGASGSGNLANVTFQIRGAGYSTLAQQEDTTKLLDSTYLNPLPIPHTIENGSVAVVGADLAITSMQLSKTIVSDTRVTINVTIANLGNFTASSSVTLFYDSTEIATQTITDLEPSATLILPFTWDTKPIPKGNYTISAYAHPVIGENNVENNRLVGGWITEAMLGDLNGDGQVNILDISIVARAFGSKPGNPKWNPNADLDNNGVVNIVDISKVAKEFGKKDP